MRLSLDMGLGSVVTLSAGGGWSPAQLGAARLADWNADRADLISLSGASVTSWRDEVAGYNFAQALTASQAVYSATGFNGSPAVSPDGTDDYYEIAGGVPAGLPTGGTPCEVWSLVQQSALAADATTRNALAWGTQVAGQRRSVTRAVVSAVNRARSSAGNNSADTNATDTVVDLSTRHVIRTQMTASQVIVSVDNGATTAAANVLAGTSAVRMRLFASASTTANGFWSGPTRRHIITTPLTTDQAAQMLAYLLARRNL